jgi:hypothetical protein
MIRKPAATSFNDQGPDAHSPNERTGKRLRFALFMARDRGTASRDDEALRPDIEERADYERHETPKPEWETPLQPRAAAQPVNGTRVTLKRR